jgi:hypothetical protein
MVSIVIPHLLRGSWTGLCHGRLTSSLVGHNISGEHRCLVTLDHSWARAISGATRDCDLIRAMIPVHTDSFRVDIAPVRWTRLLLKSLGPGVITGAADDDPSGIASPIFEPVCAECWQDLFNPRFRVKDPSTFGLVPIHSRLTLLAQLISADSSLGIVPSDRLWSSTY